MASSGNQLGQILKRARSAQSGDKVPSATQVDDATGTKRLAKSPRKSSSSQSPRRPQATTITERGKSGKRSDPAYGQTTVWLRRTLMADIDDAIRRARIDGEDLGDRSDLIGTLLETWLKERRL